MNTIFYFSGTGNSRHVAETLGRLTGDRLVDMADAGSDVMAGCQPGARLGWVFPVHAWGLPRVVERFIDRMPAMRRAETPYYIYAILTCGDDIGRADRLLRRCLARKGLTVDSVYSVRMPNTYVGLPGFDVDAPALAAEKLNAAERELSLIAADVVARRVGVCRVVPGAWPGLKSGPLRWLFGHLIPTYRWFSVRRDRCTACGACRRHCPTHNVVADSEGRPVWRDDCTGCLACYHYCPAQAVRYGPFARRKGQYHYPECQGESPEKN